MRNKKKVAEVRCQRCNQMGHWTYQCTNPPAYNYRPSRMMQYKESQLRYKLNEDEGPKGPKITDGDKRRTVKTDKDSDLEQLVEKLIESESSSSSSISSSSSSSDSEDQEEQSQKEEVKKQEKLSKAKAKQFKEDEYSNKKIGKEKTKKRSKSRSHEKKRK